jgi:hypothetical protein
MGNHENVGDAMNRRSFFRSALAGAGLCVMPGTALGLLSKPEIVPMPVDLVASDPEFRESMLVVGCAAARLGASFRAMGEQARAATDVLRRLGATADQLKAAGAHP